MTYPVSIDFKDVHLEIENWSVLIRDNNEDDDGDDVHIDSYSLYLNEGFSYWNDFNDEDFPFKVVDSIDLSNYRIFYIFEDFGNNVYNLRRDNIEHCKKRWGRW